MTDADWNDASALAVAIYLDGSDSPDRAADGTFLGRRLCSSWSTPGGIR